MNLIRHLNYKRKQLKDIVTTLDDTIKQLEEYLTQLKQGEIHDIQKYEGSRNGEFAESLTKQEIITISNTLAHLKKAKIEIKRGRFAENTLHYDLSSKSIGDEC